MHSGRRTALIGLVVFGLSTLGAVVARGAPPPPEPVRFNRDIRPLLSEHCYSCHGPDSARRQAGLRLDRREGALAPRGGRAAVVPGHPERSELLRRVAHGDERLRMPPAAAGKRLTAAQVALLRRWIAAGAPWEQHWSLIPPAAPPVPATAPGGKQDPWVRNPVDSFVLQRLQRAGLRPAPEADPAVLARRVSLDLTGLPPAPAEVDAFLQEYAGGRSPAAYERLVDRLLASPRYGERMAARWLDGARYADTNGYQSDGERFMWRWRDWVIDAYNADLPYDRFTVEQLAGDLLPRPTLEQRIATGFNRNHRGNGEGGIIPEEYLLEYAVDRLETTTTVWLGMTVGCARCHDHKFDPVSQREFYRLLAFFNNLDEKGRANKFGNSPPMIPAPTRGQQAELAALDQKLRAAEGEQVGRESERSAAQEAWEQGVPAALDWAPTDRLAAHLALDGPPPAPAAARGGSAVWAAGVRGRSLELDGKGYLEAGDLADFGFQQSFTLAAWVLPRGDGTVLSRGLDVPRGAGYALTLHGRRLQVNLVARWLDDALRMESELPLLEGRWQHVAVTYDGSRVAPGLKVYVDGAPVRTRVLLDELNQNFRSPEPLRIGAGGGPEGRLRGQVDEVRCYTRVLSAEEIGILAAPESLGEIAQLPRERRSPRQSAKLAAGFIEQHASAPLRAAWERVRQLRREREVLIAGFPTTMVMEEMSPRRPTHVLQRGQYDHPGERVTAGVPAALPLLPPGPPNRLTLARWLTRPDHPLTARVAVNRTWQMLFGAGLVRTTEDFGSQGEWPTHPELLDYLAAGFSRGRLPGGKPWSLKALVRLIVTSATYRQSSRVTPELLRRDPDNRLLARAPRLRLPPEMLRDQALAAGGLLVEKLGGPSVRPYQPAGLWTDLTGGVDYVPDRGEGLYRRSLYTFWKRTSPPPAMMAFDAAGRETCTVRESRTNTPLQALNLMNDVTYVEAARALAQRALAGCPLGVAPSAEARLAVMFRRVLARAPRPAELAVLREALEAQVQRFRGDPDGPARAARLLKVGASAVDTRADPAELAAYATVASMVLNLDEAIVRE